MRLAVVMLALGCTEGKDTDETPSFETDCGNDVDDDEDGTTDCADDDCEDSPDCVLIEDCDNGTDDDGDGDADCDDTDCDCHEDCTNGEDDDEDGLTDCEDPDCEGSGACIGLESWEFSGEGVYTETDSDEDGTSDVFEYDGTTHMWDIVVDDRGGLYDNDDVLCHFMWPVTQAAEPLPPVACEGCEWAILLAHAEGAYEGPHCLELYDPGAVAGSFIDGFYPGIGYHLTYNYGSPASMYYLIDIDDGIREWRIDVFDHVVSFDSSTGAHAWHSYSYYAYYYYPAE